MESSNDEYVEPWAISVLESSNRTALVGRVARVADEWARFAGRFLWNDDDQLGRYNRALCHGETLWAKGESSVTGGVGNRIGLFWILSIVAWSIGRVSKVQQCECETGDLYVCPSPGR